MNSKNGIDIAFTIAAFYLKFAGLWFANNSAEKLIRNVTIVYSVCCIAFNAGLQVLALYVFWGDVNDTTVPALNIMINFMDLFKVSVIVVHKKVFLNLIAYMKESFWHSNYDRHENLFIADAKQITFYFVCIFTFCTQTTIFSYIARAITANIGKNESDRTLMFDMFLGPVQTMSPYFEIIFVVQMMSIFPIGIYYVCFDNIFCIMCLHVSSQFRILQYRIAKMPRLLNGKNDPAMVPSDKFYAMFRDFVEHHKSLIEFCNSLEETYTVFMLGQVVMFSALISFSGYQVVMVDLETSWLVTLLLVLLTDVCQLGMFTYSCGCVMQESLNVSEAVYNGPWIHLPNDKYGSMYRKDLQTVIMRAREPCCLTASGFFPISLETFTKIMSTAISYFTLLNQSNDDRVDT